MRITKTKNTHLEEVSYIKYVELYKIDKLSYIKLLNDTFQRNYDYSLTEEAYNLFKSRYAEGKLLYTNLNSITLGIVIT
jgi:hypothetical protein